MHLFHQLKWDIACLTRIDPQSFPQPEQMALPNGKKDRRKIMVRLLCNEFDSKSILERKQQH